MDENRIYAFFDADNNLVEFVTHADYRALEEINRQLVGKSNRLTILTARLEEELASIKARVESMQDRIDAYQEKGLIQ